MDSKNNGCIKSVTYSFVNKGAVFGNVRPQRGIRQGDPLSPYIYLFCAEGLSSIIRRHENADLIHGMYIARGLFIFRTYCLWMTAICSSRRLQ